MVNSQSISRPKPKQKQHHIWVEATRPKTLLLAFSSILTGTALAYQQQYFDAWVAILSLVTATLLQITANLANDYGDYINGCDTKERQGPIRGIQLGNMTLLQLRIAIILVTVASVLSGVALIIRASQDYQDIVAFIFLGLVAIIAAITYTVGRRPYGYMGFGDISVFIFFGFLAVGGSFYLQAHSLDSSLVLPAAMAGLLSSAVLNINNLRDMEQDKQVGKNTLIVRIGERAGKIYHACLITAAIICASLFALMYFKHWYSFLFVLVIPFFIWHIVSVFKSKTPRELNPLLGHMAKLTLLFNITFSLGLILP